MRYRLVGYDRKTERQAHSYDIPANRSSYAQGVARIPPDDPNAVGDIELSGSQARDIAGVIGVAIDVQSTDYFLEPYEEAAAGRQRKQA